MLPHETFHSGSHCSGRSRTCRRCWAWRPALRWRILPSGVPADTRGHIYTLIHCWLETMSSASQEVLFVEDSHLSVVELHRVISGQGNNQAFLMELQQRVLGIFQEQAVVTERWHGNGDLSQEVQILEHRTLEQEQGRQDHLSNKSTDIFNTWQQVMLLSKTPLCYRNKEPTFLRLSPCEMLSAVMKEASRWVMAPASPQWGLNKNVFMPLCLENRW